MNNTIHRNANQIEKTDNCEQNSEACETLPRLPEQRTVKILDTVVKEKRSQNDDLDFIVFGFGLNEKQKQLT